MSNILRTARRVDARGILPSEDQSLPIALNWTPALAGRFSSPGLAFENGDFTARKDGGGGRISSLKTQARSAPVAIRAVAQITRTRCK